MARLLARIVARGPGRRARTNPGMGLPESEAGRRLADLGLNELPEAPPVSPLRLFLAQFASLIVWVLIGAAAISGLLADWVDTTAILAIVVLNAALGFIQEYRAERSLAALKKLSVTTARVIRDGAVRSIPARELVLGDLIQVEAGDHVPADARLVYATALRTQVSALIDQAERDDIARRRTGRPGYDYTRLRAHVGLSEGSG